MHDGACGVLYGDAYEVGRQVWLVCNLHVDMRDGVCGGMRDDKHVDMHVQTCGGIYGDAHVGVSGEICGSMCGDMHNDNTADANGDKYHGLYGGAREDMHGIREYA